MKRLLYRMAAFALVVVAGIAGTGDGGAPRAESTVAAGVLAQLNSKAGSAILTASNIGPGNSSSGIVTITNTGNLAGGFELGKSKLTDQVGPNRGALSGALVLTVEDVSVAARQVYRGALGAMPPVDLGTFQPGESHTYRFTVGLPDRGAEIDNLYVGASTTVQFDWVARADTRPAAPAERRPGRTAPPAKPARPKVGVKVTVPRRQRILRQRGIWLRVRCNRPCLADLRVRLKAGARAGSRPWRVKRALSAGRTYRIKVKFSRRELRHIRALLRRTPSLRILVSARAKDRSRSAKAPGRASAHSSVATKSR